MVKINVSLFGTDIKTGSVEIMSCDNPDTCSVFKENKCLNKQNEYGKRGKCPKGKTEYVRGYNEKYKKDPQYNAISKTNCLVADVGEYIYIKTKVFYPIIENGEVQEIRPTYEDGYVFISKKELSTELIAQLLNKKPPKMHWGSEETAYQEKIVPMILHEIKKKLPDLYAEIIKTQPDFAERKVSYIGKYAYIRTMTDGSILKDCHGNEFVLKRGRLTCGNYENSIIEFTRDGRTKIEIDIAEDAIYEIREDSQWNENTRFL